MEVVILIERDSLENGQQPTATTAKKEQSLSLYTCRLFHSSEINYLGINTIKTCSIYFTMDNKITIIKKRYPHYDMQIGPL